MEEELVFIAVMELNEARTHQIKLKSHQAELILRTNPSTCTSGCKVTVEVWGHQSDRDVLENYFRESYLKNLQGHMPNFQHMNEVFDSSKSEVVCQACGMTFSSSLSSCPDCGLVYF